MHDAVADPVSLSRSTEFVVVIAWNGPEDKPYYKAMLVSESRASDCRNEPFWGCSAITTAEFGKLLEVLNTHSLRLLRGAYQKTISEYYLTIETDSRQYYCSLGHDKTTVQVLEGMAGALEASNRKPIVDIIVRIGSTFK
jgi:hypothetical protein